jgi:hypothetical protein
MGPPEEGEIHMRTNRPFLFCAGAILLSVRLSTFCAAQSANPTSRVVFNHVRPDMINEWVDLQKNEVVPALKKGGVKTRTVYATGTFGATGEYVVITPFEKFAVFDGDNRVTKALGSTGAARLLEKGRKCLVSQNAFATTQLSDLSNVIPGAVPAVVVLARYRISPGKVQEMENLVKSDILPVYKKAKVGLTVTRRGPGANTCDVTFGTQLAKYADLDGGPFLLRSASKWRTVCRSCRIPSSDCSRFSVVPSSSRSVKSGGIWRDNAWISLASRSSSPWSIAS